MRFLIVFISFLFTIGLPAQSIDYPQGVYMTYNELLAKKPSKVCEFFPVKRKISDYRNLLAEYNKIELKHDKDVYLKYIQLMNTAEAQNK